MNFASHARNFVNTHIVTDVPTSVEDLFDHDEATPTGKLCLIATVLASANIVAFAFKTVFLS
ncbi:hypothetical protein G6L37_00740 [Agrobacterium rubi]|nr:hypothetical protein [Agrobacterium rubi]NTF23917.1 hypothetical protein [Agrobacterium rubi]